MKRKILLTLTTLLIVFTSGAQTRGKQLCERADEAFAADKWKSASTLYDILLKDSTSYTVRMARFVYASIEAGDSMSNVKTDQFLAHNQYRLDTLLKDVSRLSIRMKNFDNYERAIERATIVFPHYRDTLASALVAYHTLLRRPEAIIRLADNVLLENPNAKKWTIAKGTEIGRAHL